MSTEEQAQRPSESLLDFFVVFSRFEYALKRAGYVQPARDERESHRPVVDWEKFRLKVKRDGSLNPASGPVEEAVAYLLRHPPRVQRLSEDGQTIEWVDLPITDGDHELWRLLLIVRTVRNNLFHGGKYPYIHVDEADRDVRLLEHSMTVVGALIGCDGAVAELYDETVRAWAEQAGAAG